ncbi:general transcription factor IIF subunit 1-like [Drosophila obscura]|uniref:general transcription factor IIF subunit 1-like n=1 Tax=Drosophila obscura TaxID=7282 RepID=UPI001BB11F3B|nr:general transcription factor IIF subunit 1-like [Drosophila obscura]
MPPKKRKNLKRPSVAKKNASSAVAAAAPTAKAPKNSANEFIIRVPKVRNQRHLMRFNDNLNVDFAQWRSVKMSRENNKPQYMIEEEQEKPKFGAGTEYNWRQHGDTSRKKNVVQHYKPEAQPWLLQVDGKTGKKFKGIRTGEVGANAAYYVFTHAPDGRFNAYPINDWYAFQPIDRYKALTSEEVEAEFSRREKSLNYFNLMMRRRCRGEQDEEDTDSSKLPKSVDNGTLALQITDDVEWMDSADESESDEEEKAKKKKKESDVDATDGKKAKAKGKKELDMKTFFEAFEESDDGDEEGRERDYISDSSEDEPDLEDKAIKELKGVSEEEALRKLLNSDDEEDDDKSDNQKDECQENPQDDAFNIRGLETPSSLSSEESSIESSDSSDSEKDPSDGPPRKRVTFNKKEKRIYNAANKSPSSGASPKDCTKRKVPVGSTPPSTCQPTVSKGSIEPPNEEKDSTQVEQSAVFLRKIDEFGVSEEAVIRYLKRKPLTPTELLSKFRNKATSDSKIRVVETMTKILKKINPIKTTIQGKLYFSIK